MIDQKRGVKTQPRDARMHTRALLTVAAGDEVLPNVVAVISVVFVVGDADDADNKFYFFTSTK